MQKYIIFFNYKKIKIFFANTIIIISTVTLLDFIHDYNTHSCNR